MGDRTLEGINAGMRLVGVGVDAYERAKEWQAKLQATQYTRDKEQKALDLEASRHQEDVAQLVFKNKEQKDKDVSTEAHLKKQDELADVEIASIKAGKGRYGNAGRTTLPADITQANKNLDNARKAMAPYMSGGLKAPQELQDEYHAALSDVDRLSAGMGLHPASRKPADASPPVDGWMQKIKGALMSGSAPLVGAEDWKQYDR